MHDELLRAYGPQHWWPAKTPFEVILGAYLTQNTAWKAVERSLENLRAAGALTVDGLRAIPLAKLRRLIRPSGFITRKAPALKAFVAMLDEEFGGSLERWPLRLLARCASGCWNCPAWAPRRPTRFCFTRLGMRFPWRTSICAASPSGTGLLSCRQAEREFPTMLWWISRGGRSRAIRQRGARNCSTNFMH